ncbi:subtilase family N-terminal domain-containing protein [Dysgonomonas sp. 25]|uniref:subtilase family N-terminal domain-containing protein n=1 Tax=Dysgonomonas sp. 25 TaxID=2302933 RepID=UPI0013D62934|nr:subtilase family N-terminal domain-containing protein [Dysgonomonas sp. 25]NDV69326.1 T9SS C-terminal target domain-containing protein [Dysgonomonas sp. 25]
MKHCLTILKGTLILSLLLLAAIGVYAQDTGVYKNGVRQGVINVKFTPEMAEKMQKAKISTKSDKLSTGIATFDKAAKSINAMKMKRAFPETPQTAAKLRKYGLHLWYTIEMDQNVDPQQAVEAFRKQEGVALVEVDREKGLPPHTISRYIPGMVKAGSTQPFDDPLLKDQWHYNNTGQYGMPDVYDANVYKAWKLTAGKSNIIVSVHDAGIDTNHEDLKDNMWVNPGEINSNGLDDDMNGYADDIHGWNFTYDMPTMVPADHGTHVAGTIAAVNNNGKGVSGVAGGTGNGDGVKIMALQMIGASTVNTANSYIYAANNGAVISQNSWSYTREGVFEPMVLDAIQYFIGEAGDYDGSPMKGGIVIFASGNKLSEAVIGGPWNPQGDWYPGNREYVFTVNSLGPDGRITGYSNFGTWTNISAPGGNSSAYGSPASVLSTLVGNEYGYMDGTSMACPHVSGIAALALANSPTKMTNTMLWKKLENAGRNIDALNADTLVGKMGAGGIDALLAVQNDEKIAPNRIQDLEIKIFDESSATLEWTVPEDQDNLKPEQYTVYYSKEQITSSNYKNAYKLELLNTAEAGEKITATVEGLVGNTIYYFAVTSADIFENVSDLSNIISGKSTIFASIDVNTGVPTKDITMAANVPVSPIATTSFDILNNSTGTLSWDYSMRNVNSVMATMSMAPSYNPIVSIQNASRQYNVGESSDRTVIGTAYPTAIKTKAGFTPFEQVEKSYTLPLNIAFIGDNDTSIPVSSAVKYIVDEEEGFNLTHVYFNLSYKAGTGNVIVEVYKDDLDKKNLVHKQYFNYHLDLYRQDVSVDFKEQLFFEKGSTFYIAIHVPKGNLYPLRIEQEASQEYSTYCYYSSSEGEEWVLLEQVLSSWKGPQAALFAWNTIAVSATPDTGKYLTLDPASGTVGGNSSSTIQVTADGTYMINGVYKTNLILNSNSSVDSELRVPVTFTVSGHKPKIVYPTITSFGNLITATDTLIDVVFENHGYGLIKNLTASITGSSDFTLVGTPADKILARNNARFRVKFSPSVAGNINGTLKITDGTSTFNVSLNGIGLGAPEIDLDPAAQTKPGLTLGSTVQAEIKVKNIGTYPLKYFVPGFDDREISKDWPDSYHSYGYIVRGNNASVTTDTSLPNAFLDISTTGTDITNQFIGANLYVAVPMEFKFPYYNTEQDTIYITTGGFTTFDNTVRPVNVPQLNGPSSPRGYISMLGYSIYDASYPSGKVLYKSEPDRLIIQYENGVHKASGDIYTAQMVLHANGDIRFYYQTVPPSGVWGGDHIMTFIEDVEKKDALLVRDEEDTFFITNGTAIGFDYPGKPVITSIENASGSVSPGEFVTMKVNIATDQLAEGTINQYVNIVSNDPLNKQVHGLIELDITSGGTENYRMSKDTVDFGGIYKSINYQDLVRVYNTGTKDLSVGSVSFDPAKYTITYPALIKAGQYGDFVIVPNTANTGSVDDELEFQLGGGTLETIPLLGDVSLSPIITADASLVTRTMNLTDTEAIPFTITNTGYSDLDYTVQRGTVVRFDDTTSPIEKYGYEYVVHSNGEATYNWIDITQTGTKIPGNGLANIWQDVPLSFNFKFYDVDYNAIKINNWGLVAFGGTPPAINNRTARLPMVEKSPSYIAAGLATLQYNLSEFGDAAGFYYQDMGDYFVVSWEYYTIRAMGTNSMQLILYKDGSFKFQYKMHTTFSAMTQYQSIGLQRQGEATAMTYPVRQALPFTKDMPGVAMLFSSANEYKLAPGASASGNIHVEPAKAYAGTITDTLMIKSNDPTTPVWKKPFNLTVNGAPGVSASSTLIDFGTEELGFDTEGFYKKYELPLDIVNTGTAPLTITNVRMDLDNQFFTDEILWYNGNLNVWDSISNIFTGGRTMTVLPGAGNKLRTKVKFGPTTDGNFADVIIFSTDAGEVRVDVKGKIELPQSPTLNVNTNPIEFQLDNHAATEIRTVNFDNISGDIDLDYTASIKYRRYASEAHLNSAGEAETIGTLAEPISFSESVQPLLAASTKAATDYNRVLEYTEDFDAINIVIGLGGSERFTAATHFNAGPEGFNVAAVATWFRAEGITEGIVEAEVRAGGNNIIDAVTVAKGTFSFTNPNGNDNYGGIKVIELDNEATIYPNEDFYVIFRYPLLLSSPQGAVDSLDVETVPFRYMFRRNNSWYDLQTGFVGTTHTAYMHIALEKDAKGSGWVRILNNEAGIVPVGGSSSLQLEANAANAIQGEQKASLIFKSNDLVNPQIEIPVVLNLNKGPQFVNAPLAVTVAETETRNLSIAVEDAENDVISSVTATTTLDFVTYTYNSGTLRLVIAPGYADAGTHTMNFNATDEHGMITEYALQIKVTNTNRLPYYSGSVTSFTYSVQNDEQTYNINDFFSDPDDDDVLSFVATSQNPALMTVYGSTETFKVKPVAVGNTSLDFVVTDDHGGQVLHSIPVQIEDCIASEVIVQKWNSVLLVNNANGEYRADGYQWYKNGTPIDGATKQYYTPTDGSQELDFSAVYYARMTKQDGHVVYSCNYTPQRMDVSLSIYPNPVKRGEQLTLRAELPDLTTNPITIQIVNMSGQIVKKQVSKDSTTSIDVPANIGSYVLKVSQGDLSKTFKIIVE